MTRQIGAYNFRNPLPLDDARPPKNEAGVYVFIVKGNNGGQGTIRYIGSTNNLQSRVNYGHEAAKKLFSEADKKLERLLTTWIVVSDDNRRLQIEKSLIASYKGRTINIENKPK